MSIFGPLTQPNTNTMNTESTAYAAYSVHEIKQTGYGTYRIIVRDADGNKHGMTTHEVGVIEDLRAAGRELRSNDDGTYDRLRAEMAAWVAEALGLAEDGHNVAEDDD